VGTDDVRAWDGGHWRESPLTSLFDAHVMASDQALDQAHAGASSRGRVSEPVA
jgi:hypothetical protein